MWVPSSVGSKAIVNHYSLVPGPGLASRLSTQEGLPPSERQPLKALRPSATICMRFIPPRPYSTPSYCAVNVPRVVQSNEVFEVFEATSGPSVRADVGGKRLIHLGGRHFVQSCEVCLTGRRSHVRVLHCPPYKSTHYKRAPGFRRWKLLVASLRRGFAPLRRR